MAEQYTPEEIRELFEEYERQIRETGKVTGDLAERMKDAETGVKNYHYQLNQSLKQLGTSIKSFGSGLANGQSGASAFNDTIESTTNTVDKFASKFGILGKVLGGVVKAAGAYTVAVNKQADALYKTYQDLSKVGAGTAGGMTDVFNNLQKFGYTVEELGNMASLVSENSTSLAALTGTVGSGTKAFADMAAGVQRSEIGDRLLAMGMTVDSMNKGMAGYLRVQMVTGQLQKKTADELAASAAAYMVEQDKLAKLTGLAADQQNQIREQALSEERFGAKIRMMRASGDEKQIKAADELEKANLLMAKENPQMARGFRNAVAGVFDDPEAAKMLQSMPNAVLMASQDTFKASEFFKEGSKEAAQNLADFDPLRAVGAGDNFLIAGAELAKFTELNKKSLEEREASADKEQQVTDKTTQNMKDLTVAQRNATQSLQTMINKGIDPVTGAMSKLAKVTEKVVGVPGKIAPSMAPAGGKPPIGAPTAAPPVGAVDKTLLEKLGSSGITDKRAQANILAQVQAESGGKPKSENLNYSPDQLMKLFPNKFKTIEDAQAVVGQGQEAIGNRIYGGRMGNAANEGFKYRGRGLIQLTGKQNYEKFGKLLGVDLVNNPDLANDPSIAQDIAIAYFNEKQKSGTNLADIKSIGKAVGYAGGAEETARRADLANKIAAQMNTGDTKMASNVAGGVPAYASGGIASGPLEGYQAMLHGTEAVVPLPNGRSIPVEIAGFNNSFGEQNNLLAQQIARLDDLIGLMRNQVNTSQKILSYTQ